MLQILTSALRLWNEKLKLKAECEIHLRGLTTSERHWWHHSRPVSNQLHMWGVSTTAGQPAANQRPRKHLSHVLKLQKAERYQPVELVDHPECVWNLQFQTSEWSQRKFNRKQKFKRSQGGDREMQILKSYKFVTTFHFWNGPMLRFQETVRTF